MWLSPNTSCSDLCGASVQFLRGIGHLGALCYKAGRIELAAPGWKKAAARDREGVRCPEARLGARVRGRQSNYSKALPRPMKDAERP